MIAIALKVVVPLARRWVERHQQRILAEGVSLTPSQMLDAQLCGVKEPGKVRLMRVDVIPMPGDMILRNANGLARLVSGNTAGITLGHGVYVRDDLWGDRALVVHELVHVGQYERFGSIRAFLRAYLDECLTMGYPNGSLEREALIRTKEICG